MKRWFVATLILFLLFSFGCGTNDPAPEEEDPQENPIEEPVPEPEPEPVLEARYFEVPEGVSPLTGLAFQGEHWPMMVQMENTPDARPQSGIASADLIYEMEVESKITRLTVFFHQVFPEKVGPVRSARRQHITLWSEWNFLYAFYGGSTYRPGQNIYDIRDSELRIKAPSFDGMSASGVFFRTSDRKAPHNAYIDLSKHEADTVKPEKVRSLYFREDAQFEGTPVKLISFQYSTNNKVRYEYNAESGRYFRWINDVAMVDKESGTQVGVHNVIIQRANHKKVTGTVYTNIDLFGSGEALYFSQGIMKKGTWSRANKDELTVFYDENGQELCFPSGKTFIQILRTDTPVETDAPVPAEPTEEETSNE